MYGGGFVRVYCFSELCKKEIICIDDGRKLGYPHDVQFDGKCGQILNLIVPCKNTFSLFSGNNCVKIPWCDVEKIGADVIWVCGCERKDKYDNKRGDCGCC